MNASIPRAKNLSGAATSAGMMNRRIGTRAPEHLIYSGSDGFINWSRLKEDIDRGCRYFWSRRDRVAPLSALDYMAAQIKLAKQEKAMAERRKKDNLAAERELDAAANAICRNSQG